MTAIPTTESRAADKEFPIPLSRFITQAIFSALVTSVTTQLQISGAQFKGTQGQIPEFMLGFAVFVVMALVSTVFHFITVDKFLSRDDGLYATNMAIQTIILGLNYHFVTDMGKLSYDSGFTPRQHLAVNFCLTFIIVSEIEFCYANEIWRDSQEVSKYYKNSNQDCKNSEKNNAASNKDSGTNNKDSTTASITPTHVPPYTRDPFFYGYWIPPQGSDHPFSRRVISRLFFAQWLLFVIINGLLNVAVKRVVDPSWGWPKGHLVDTRWRECAVYNRKFLAVAAEPAAAEGGEAGKSCGDWGGNSFSHMVHGDN